MEPVTSNTLIILLIEAVKSSYFFLANEFFFRVSRRYLMCEKFSLVASIFFFISNLLMIEFNIVLEKLRSRFIFLIFSQSVRRKIVFQEALFNYNSKVIETCRTHLFLSRQNIKRYLLM